MSLSIQSTPFYPGSSGVSAKASIIKVGPVHYHGLVANRPAGQSGCTIVVSDVATATGGNTGTDIIEWINTYEGGTSVTGSFFNTKSELGVKMVNGIRFQACDLLISGTTGVIYWS